MLLQEEKQETCKYKSVSSRNSDWDRLRQTVGTRPSEDNKEVSLFSVIFILEFKVHFILVVLLVQMCRGDFLCLKEKK